MPTVTVNLPAGAYDVRVEAGLLAKAGEVVGPLARSGRVGVVADAMLLETHLPTLTASLKAAGVEPLVVPLPASEANKTLAGLTPMLDALLQARVDRHTPVVALGGGIVGDMAGFAAAVLLRGVPFVNIPTTLLAMVDASVGGKTGVNHAMGKNLVGSFHQPAAVLIDPHVLATLPRAEVVGGMAEVIKHACIRDAALFEKLEANLGRVFEPDMAFLTDLVAANVAIKARVVEADERETGERAHLNFGHTFAHGFESATDHREPHGAAVGVGIRCANDLAGRLGMLPSQDKQRIDALLTETGLPEAMRAEPERVLAAMRSDKKVEAGRLRLVLLEGLGRVTIRADVPEEAVLETLRGRCA
ncbi:MAG: 3-dehydroquinate synthase [Phycisphaerae bacterium]